MYLTRTSQGQLRDVENRARCQRRLVVAAVTLIPTRANVQQVVLAHLGHEAVGPAHREKGIAALGLFGLTIEEFAQRRAGLEFY